VHDQVAAFDEPVSPRRWWSLRQPTAWLILAVLAGAAARIVWCAVAVRPHVGSHDPAFYMRYAEHIAAGKGYVTDDGHPTAYYPIGYPGLLGGAWWFVRHTSLRDSLPWTAAVVNLVAGIATLPLVGFIGRRAISAWVGTVATWLVALQPNLIYNTAPALTETVFIALLAGALALLVARPMTSAPRAGRLVAAGVMLGLAGLVRPVGLIVVPALVFVVWRWRKRMLHPIRLLAMVTACALIVLAPWVVRNAVVVGRPTLATNTGDNLCIGNNPQATGGFMLPPSCFADFPNITDEHVEAQRDRVLTNRALRWIVNHPAQQPRLIFWRTYWTFLSDHDGLRAVQSYEQDPWLATYHARTESLLTTAGDAFWFVSLALGALGLVRWRRRLDMRRSLLGASLVGMAVIVWPFFGDTRFHLPVAMLVAFPAASALEGLLRRSPIAPVSAIAPAALVSPVGAGVEDFPDVPIATNGGTGQEHLVVDPRDAHEHRGDGDGEGGEHRPVSGLSGQWPAEPWGRPRHDLTGNDIGTGESEEQRAGEAEQTS
jgi:4-amino-4-deoxy-L-arabinose transferase-like glycosyltransferase